MLPALESVEGVVPKISPELSVTIDGPSPPPIVARVFRPSESRFRLLEVRSVLEIPPGASMIELAAMVPGVMLSIRRVSSASIAAGDRPISAYRFEVIAKDAGELHSSHDFRLIRLKRSLLCRARQWTAARLDCLRL